MRPDVNANATLQPEHSLAHIGYLPNDCADSRLLVVILDQGSIVVAGVVLQTTPWV